MTIRRFLDPVGRRIAIYEVPNNIGNPDDPEAPCNAPLNDPANNLQYLYFHSDYDPMEVAIGPVTVAINHLAIAAGSGSGGLGTVNRGRFYGSVIRTHELLSHNLGYVPDFFLVVGDNIVHPGFPVQFDAGDGRARCVTAYATSSKIMLHEFGVQTSSPLAAIGIEYTVLVLRRPPAPTGSVLRRWDPETGIEEMAFGKFRSDRRYLQVVDGGSPFGLPARRTLDLDNGTYRSVTADGVLRDLVPASFRLSVGFGGTSYGPNGNYQGDFLGDEVVQVQAP